MTPTAATIPATGKDWVYDTLIRGFYTVTDDRGRARTYRYVPGSGFYAVYRHTFKRVAAEATHAAPLAALLADPHAARLAYALADPDAPRCSRCNRPASNAAEQGGLGRECLAIIGRVA